MSKEHQGNRCEGVAAVQFTSEAVGPAAQAVTTGYWANMPGMIENKAFFLLNDTYHLIQFHMVFVGGYC